MKSKIQSICVFCGASNGKNPVHQKAAVELGRVLAQNKIRLVYGGASVGLMGTVADAALGAGGEVIGVIPGHLFTKEVAHSGLTELHPVKSMHERKAKMEQLSDAFIALPGGWGTFEELFEILTWAQLGLHQKPIGLLNIDGYYRHLIEMVEHGIREEFIRPEYRKLIYDDTNPARLVQRFETYEPLELPRWLTNQNQT